MFISATWMPGAKGITAKDSRAVSTTMVGATINTGRSAKGGTQSSLKNILRKSAMTCMRPKGPTRLGP